MAVALGRWNTNRKRHPPNIALQFSFTRSGGSRREEKEIPEQCDLVAAFENDILGRRTEGRQRVIGVKEREGGRERTVLEWERNGGFKKRKRARWR